MTVSAALFVLPASAHISLERGGTHKSRYGDSVLKDAPCGQANGTRGTNVYTYAPGQTIQISISEYIPHPSYFRIAFDDDGDDAFLEPASIQPIDPNRACPFNAADKCGESDFYNSAAVLPEMDNLNPHVSASLGTKYTWDVTLPNVQCQNCTLQIMQVMQDTIHGAYNPVPGDPADNPYIADNYHQCIDLILEGGTGAGGSSGSGSPAAESDDGGCSIAHRSPAQGGNALGWAAGLALVGFGLQRRVRRTARAR